MAIYSNRAQDKHRCAETNSCSRCDTHSAAHAAAHYAGSEETTAHCCRKLCNNSVSSQTNSDNSWLWRPDGKRSLRGTLFTLPSPKFLRRGGYPGVFIFINFARCNTRLHDANAILYALASSLDAVSSFIQSVFREQREAKRLRREKEREARDAARQKRSASRRASPGSGSRRGKDEL